MNCTQQRLITSSKSIIRGTKQKISDNYTLKKTFSWRTFYPTFCCKFCSFVWSPVAKRGREFMHCNCGYSTVEQGLKNSHWTNNLKIIEKWSRKKENKKREGEKLGQKRLVQWETLRKRENYKTIFFIFLNLQKQKCSQDVWKYDFYFFLNHNFKTIRIIVV